MCFSWSSGSPVWVWRACLPAWRGFPAQLWTPVQLHGWCGWLHAALPPPCTPACLALLQPPSWDATGPLLWGVGVWWWQSNQRRVTWLVACATSHQSHWETAARFKLRVQTPRCLPRWSRTNAGFYLYTLIIYALHLHTGCRLVLRFNDVIILIPIAASVCVEWTSLPLSRVPFPTSDCVPQTTDWTECSASCGFGISSRVTNINLQCKLVRETRLCQIQECDTVLAVRVRYILSTLTHIKLIIILWSQSNTTCYNAVVYVVVVTISSNLLGRLFFGAWLSWGFEFFRHRSISDLRHWVWDVEAAPAPIHSKDVQWDWVGRSFVQNTQVLAIQIWQTMSSWILL